MGWPGVLVREWSRELPRPVTATGGHWHRTVQYDVARAQPGTFEVADLSEQDGSLSCIARFVSLSSLVRRA